jgi:uncharacterized protein
MQEQLSSAYQQALKALGEAATETAETPAETPPDTPAGNPGMDEEHIERLFAEASHDRAKAFELKTELDRLGAFRQYEDRFLALFKGQ